MPGTLEDNADLSIKKVPRKQCKKRVFKNKSFKKEPFLFSHSLAGSLGPPAATTALLGARAQSDLTGLLHCPQSAPDPPTALPWELLGYHQVLTAHVEILQSLNRKAAAAHPIILLRCIPQGFFSLNEQEGAREERNRPRHGELISLFLLRSQHPLWVSLHQTQSTGWSKQLRSYEDLGSVWDTSVSSALHGSASCSPAPQ